MGPMNIYQLQSVLRVAGRRKNRHGMRGLDCRRAPAKSSWNSLLGVAAPAEFRCATRKERNRHRVDCVWFWGVQDGQLSLSKRSLESRCSLNAAISDVYQTEAPFLANATSQADEKGAVRRCCFRPPSLIFSSLKQSLMATWLKTPKQPDT